MGLFIYDRFSGSFASGVVLAQATGDSSQLRTVLSGIVVLFSVGVLVFALTRAFKQMPIRPVFDYLRLGLQIAGVVIMAVVVGVSSSTQLLIWAVAAGLVVGAIQGRGLEVSAGTERVWARRSSLGAAVWGVSLIGMQIAGFANRAGIVVLGQTMAWFAVGITVGAMIGRSENVRTARRSIKPAAVAAAVVVLTLGAPFTGGNVSPASAQAAGEWVRGPGRILGGTPIGNFQVSLGASGGVVNLVIAENPATGATGGTLPNSVDFGAPPETLGPNETGTASASVTPSDPGAFNAGYGPSVQVIAEVNNVDVNNGLAASVKWSCKIDNDFCDVPPASSGSVSFSLGAGSSDGATATFSWRVQQCGDACKVEWVYTWQEAAPPTTTTAAATTTASADDDDTSVLPLPVAGEPGQEGGGDSPEAGGSSVTDPDPRTQGQIDIDRTQAARQAAAGLLVLVALGLVNLAEVLPLFGAFERVSGDTPIISSHRVPTYDGGEIGVIVVDANHDGVADTAYVDVDQDGVIDRVEPWTTPESPDVGTGSHGTFEALDHGAVSEFPGALPTVPDGEPETGFFTPDPNPIDAESGIDASETPAEAVEPRVAPPPQDFLGRDTADTIASTATAMQQAGEDLDALASDVGVPDEVRERVRERIKPAAERLESIRETAERARDAVDWAKDIGDDTERRLARLGVPRGLRDGIVWLRGMFGWVGGIAQDAATNYLAPVTGSIGRVLGMEPDKVAEELFPVGDFGTQLGDMVVTGAENIKGGANYGGQLSDNAGTIPGDAGNTGLDDIFGPNAWGRQ